MSTLDLLRRITELEAEKERLRAEGDLMLANHSVGEGKAIYDEVSAALARVRAALDREHICVMEACCNDAVRAALEGRS